MKLKYEGCIFLASLDAGNCYEPWCVLKRDYCLYASDCNKCRVHVHPSDWSQISNILNICLMYVQNV